MGKDTREREREREREQERDIKLILRKAVIEKCVLGPLIMRLGRETEERLKVEKERVKIDKRLNKEPEKEREREREREKGK